MTFILLNISPLCSYDLNWCAEHTYSNQQFYRQLYFRSLLEVSSIQQNRALFSTLYSMPLADAATSSCGILFPFTPSFSSFFMCFCIEFFSRFEISWPVSVSSLCVATMEGAAHHSDNRAHWSETKAWTSSPLLSCHVGTDTFGGSQKNLADSCGRPITATRNDQIIVQTRSVSYTWQSSE